MNTIKTATANINGQNTVINQPAQDDSSPFISDFNTVAGTTVPDTTKGQKFVTLDPLTKLIIR